MSSTTSTTSPPGTGPATTEAVAATNAPGPVTQETVVTTTSARYALAAARLGGAVVFLWPFTDKLLGLGYATPAERAWVAGGAPTQGYLQNGVQGPLASTFTAMAGPLTDWLFMLGLLGVGMALLLGIGLRVAAVSGSVLFALLWLSQWPVTPGSTNPVVDSHVVIILLLAVLATTLSGDTWGLGRRWAVLPLVRRAPWLR
ncbi:DoxX family protein [Cellulosimicrobium marinum]|uniref:DoxX family protein n=1 Tax=Cellulosimicrobium marinum TaxID=1638992 RepID=UPI001E58BFF8|nr:DoxX family protein [Cellulosimicrobium marinum]MCB7137861.1 DoxX family protein [Cellulosimicrobium marinum]